MKYPVVASALAGLVLASSVWAETNAVMPADASARPIEVGAPSGPPIGLQGGADSVDALIDRLVAALEKGDKATLKQLRVSEEEYRRIIVPGRVQKGNPPRNPAKRNVDYFWGMLDHKSDLYADNLVENFGGRKYAEHRYELSKETNRWAWYNAYGELRMRLVGADDEKAYLVQAGWIVEVDGAFKFLGYEYDS